MPRRPTPGPAWTPISSVLCFNTAEGRKNNVATPTSWKDIAQARLQGQDRDAASGLVRHRLSHRRGLDADHGREGSLGVHGQAARQHRGLHAFGLGALRAGRQGRAHGRHRASTCAARARRPRARRSSIVLPKEGAGWELEATSIVKGTKNLDARQEGRRLGRHQGRERALLEVLRDRRRAEREEHAAELSGRPPSRRW